MRYEDFLKSKIVISEDFGFEVDEKNMASKLKPHQKDICLWALKGGRRAVFANFGLGKTFMQLEIAKQCIDKENKPFLIVCPLAVSGEFKRDNRKLNTGYEITYITDTDTIQDYKPQIYLSNYERVRMGDIDASKFCGVSFDEASILRNLKTETTNYVLSHFKKVPYRFVATATPTPNDFIEILNYADYLGVISRGHALTRFFQRDSTKAGNLTLYPNKKKEFWMWVSTWAVFVNKPSDLGYSDEGYDLPEMNIVEHCVSVDSEESYINKDGELVMFKDISKSLIEVSREKRESIKNRCDKAFELAIETDSAIVWHHLEAERQYLEKLFKEKNAQSVYGAQPNPVKEDLLIGFSENKYQYLLTKARIAGSGCNFQEYCHTAIFAGIDYKFNDFIQAIHRIYRFGQTKQVNIHIIYTENEYEVLKVLYKKWEKHKELQQNMIELVKEFGLNKDIIKQQMERQLFKNGKKIIIGGATLYNNDTVIIHSDKNEMPDNSVHMILTSIPFGDHYEYSDNYNDMGHNHGNGNFFKQMEYLTPNLLRVLKPGRIAAIHVKDRIRYSYQNGTKFTTIDDFSGQTVAHFVKHGFYLLGKITVTTDVVRENNQTYRLGWTEQCKDATKMGCGMPEYVLLFRKAPSQMNNAYADEPVEKTKEEYDISTWQLDAHAYYRSNGDRFLTYDELKTLDFDKICKSWAKHNKESIYSYEEHLRTCQDLEDLGKLSKLFTTLPVHSNTDMVWSDVNRMNTLNAKQVSSKKEKHICPLQIDIIKRLINRFSMKGEIVDDPFGGLFSTPYVAMEMGRGSVSVELNSEYYADGLSYIHAMHHKMNVPTLFDVLKEELV
jgi:DNA modification methylase